MLVVALLDGPVCRVAACSHAESKGSEMKTCRVRQNIFLSVGVKGKAAFTPRLSSGSIFLMAGAPAGRFLSLGESFAARWRTAPGGNCPKEGVC